jgi:hypothetical protein
MEMRRQWKSTIATAAFLAVAAVALYVSLKWMGYR